MPFLLDTNILSELRKGSRCDPNVSNWAAKESTQAHYISVLSLGEIRKGIELLSNKSPEKCIPLEKWLERLHSDYANCTIATISSSLRFPYCSHSPGVRSHVRHEKYKGFRRTRNPDCEPISVNTPLDTRNSSPATRYFFRLSHVPRPTRPRLLA